MKLIRQVKLFFIEGKSDKVYEIDLCELSSTEYLVNFRYGRRGTPLKEGTKTPAAVPMDKAEALFAALETEKRKKGYQSENETFVEMPSLDVVDPGTKEGVILQRLQDAVEKKNSFKTEWKTSRVIWKAGELNLKEAIPFVMRLCKGDDLQVYAALHTLFKLEAMQAELLFKSYITATRQKDYIRNISTEALLTFFDEESKQKLYNEICGKLPAEVWNAIEVNDYDTFFKEISDNSQREYVSYFTDLYFICKEKTDLLPYLHKILKSWTLRPPYFKQIRAIYKLAQLRKDYATVAILSYRFEKEPAMFNSKPTYYGEYEKYVEAIDEYLDVQKELKSKESRLAYSNSTKKYFLKNSINQIKKAGAESGAKQYLKLAVSTLLQYTEDDYAPAGEYVYNYYGEYNYQERRYYFTLFNSPECYKSPLLTTILWGNDSTRTMRSNFQYIYGKRVVVSNNYYYNANSVRDLEQPQQSGSQQTGTNRTVSSSSQSSQSDSLLGKLKNIFGSKREETITPPPIPVVEKQEEVIVEKQLVTIENSRPELYPEYWDAMPQAYVQLLIQAQMNVIHTFAYNNLKAHPAFDEICSKFDKNLLQLLNSKFELPNLLGFEILEKRKDEFKNDIAFIASILNSNGTHAHQWAKTIVDENYDFYLNDLDFVISLISNTKEDNAQWIETLLTQKTIFSEERLQAILGKSVSTLLRLDNTEDNDILAKVIIGRINIVAANQLNKINWDIVEQLIVSPLLMNTWLASSITLKKVENAYSIDIPVSLVELFLKSDITEIRMNGVKLINLYPDKFVTDNFDFILSQTDNTDQPVVVSILEIISKLLIRNDKELGNKAVRYFVYTMIRKERFEGAHTLFNQFINSELKPYFETGLTIRDITKLVHAQYRQSQLLGYELLKNYSNPNDFTLGQIISFGNHEILAVRQWCWKYYNDHIDRIRYERDKALNILDAKWDDTRAFAFNFFKTRFTESDWDTDTLISIVDSIRPDVEAFGKELINIYFKPENALDYLTKLSQHPSINVQAFVTGFLTKYAAGNDEVICDLDFYFRSVLTRVNKARVAKDRIYTFLQEEARKRESAAAIIVPILDDISAQSTIQDKSTCIDILTEIKLLYPHLEMHLAIKEKV